MLFPIDDLLDETACYELLLSVLHPKGVPSIASTRVTCAPGAITT